MPIYEYACSRCEQTFEVLQPLGADLSVCGPFCRAADRRGDGAVHKIFSVPALKSAAAAPAEAPMCGRCGGPGPGCE